MLNRIPDRAAADRARPETRFWQQIPLSCVIVASITVQTRYQIVK